MDGTEWSDELQRETCHDRRRALLDYPKRSHDKLQRRQPGKWHDLLLCCVGAECRGREFELSPSGSHTNSHYEFNAERHEFNTVVVAAQRWFQVAIAHESFFGRLARRDVTRAGNGRQPMASDRASFRHRIGLLPVDEVVADARHTVFFFVPAGLHPIRKTFQSGEVEGQ